MRLYIDTSAFVKYYGNPAFEKDIAEVEKIVGECVSGLHTLSSSYWLVPETLAAIDSWPRKRFITESERVVITARAVSDINQWLERGYLTLTGVPQEIYLLPEFLTLITDHHLSPGDALHVHTSRLSQPDVFITADGNQQRAAQTLSLRVFNPELESWGQVGTQTGTP